jgi:glyoxylase-like metal-dependent hydrolase (beta-lactamase superfamily II)
MLLFIFPTGPLRTNALLIACPRTGEAAAIDPAHGSARLILETINSFLAKVEKHKLYLSKILLTHSHWDHIADLHLLLSTFKDSPPLLYVHPLDRENVEKPGSDGLPLFFPIPGVTPNAFLQEGDLIQIGTLSFSVIHTPGHSPGSVCFYSPQERLLLSGDTLFKGGIGNLSLPTGNRAQMGPSLAKLRALPPETRVIPGHGAETTIGQEFL